MRVQYIASKLARAGDGAFNTVQFSYQMLELQFQVLTGALSVNEFHAHIKDSVFKSSITCISLHDYSSFKTLQLRYRCSTWKYASKIREEIPVRAPMHLQQSSRSVLSHTEVYVKLNKLFLRDLTWKPSPRMLRKQGRLGERLHHRNLFSTRTTTR